MYYQNYEDYMRSVLGYPVENKYTYENYNAIPEERNYQLLQEMEEMYPEIYQKLMPLIIKECETYSETITKDNIESIVDKIYSNIEINNNEMAINVAANTQNRQIRKPNNPLLRDLIKILVLNRLIGGLFPNRPPHPQRPPMRPPYPLYRL